MCASATRAALLRHSIQVFTIEGGENTRMHANTWEADGFKAGSAGARSELPRLQELALSVAALKVDLWSGDAFSFDLRPARQIQHPWSGARSIRRTNGGMDSRQFTHVHCIMTNKACRNVRRTCDFNVTGSTPHMWQRLTRRCSFAPLFSRNRALQVGK